MKLQIGRVKVSYTDLSAGTRFLEAPICVMLCYYYFMKEVTPSAEAGINGEP